MRSLLLTLLLLLTSCIFSEPIGFPKCVEADDFGGSLSNRTFSLKASKSSWSNSNILVKQGEVFSIYTGGFVNLCTNYTKTFETDPVKTYLDNSEIYIYEGAPLKITTKGYYKEFAEDNDDCEDDIGYDAYYDSSCTANKGRGLFTFIGEDPPALRNDEINSYTREQDDDDGFFEVYDQEKKYIRAEGSNWYIPGEETNYRGGYDGISKTEGYVYFGHAQENHDTGEKCRKRLENDSYDEANSSHAKDSKERMRESNCALVDIFKYSSSGNNTGSYKATVETECYGYYGKWAQLVIHDSIFPPKAGEGKIINLHEFGNFEDAGFTGNIRADVNGILWFRVVDKPLYWKDLEENSNEGQELTEEDLDVDPEDYKDNNGSYKIDVNISSSNTGVVGLEFVEYASNLAGYMESLVLTGPDNLAQTMFVSLVPQNEGATSYVIEVVRILLVLSIIIYGLSFILGFIQEPLSDFFIRSFKIIIVVQLISPDSWSFFNEYLFNVFITGSDNFINNFGSIFYGGGVCENDFTRFENKFCTLSIMAYQFTSSAVLAKILSIIFSGPFGFFISIIMLIIVGIFATTVISAIILYIVAVIAVGLLIGLTPIFLPLILFEQTKSYCVAWIRTLISFAIQPVFLFAVIFTVFGMVGALMFEALNFAACWQPVFSIPLIPDFAQYFASNDPQNSEMDFDLELPLLYFYAPWGYEAEGNELLRNSSNITDAFRIVVVLLMFILVTKQMIHWAAGIALTIFSGSGKLNLQTFTDRLSVKGAFMNAKAKYDRFKGGKVKSGSGPSDADKKDISAGGSNRDDGDDG